MGLRKASLYSHFENKQAILDALVEALTAEYEQHSLFARADWNDPDFTRPLKNRPVEEIMAAQLAWPISILVYLCDREPEREAEALAFADRHVRQFFTIYGT